MSEQDQWFVRSFGELYPLIYRHRDDAQAAREVRKIAQLLGLGLGQRVLDICCGTGRHTEALVDLNLAAFGVDLSDSLLRRAIERPGLRGRIARADIRALPFEASFDAAVNLFTSFGYFLNEDENRAALKQMVRTLQPGGRFLIDLANPEALRRSFEPESEQQLDDWHLRHSRHWEDGRVVKHTIATAPDGQRHAFTENVRIYEPDELLAMCTSAGLGELQLVGSFDGEPMQADSPRLIAVGRRL